MKTLAIITARGGSKRIPHKNIKEFCGKPLIAYSIEAAILSKTFSRVIVSTDSSDIRDVALKFGAEVPFLRSNENSNDFSTTADVILEVLSELKKQNEVYDYVCCIYPTAPMITADKLSKAFDLLKNENADSVVPVVRFSFPIQRAFVINDKFVKLREEQYKNTRSQDLEETFHDSGQFYWIHTISFLEQKELFMKKCFPFILPESEVQDIDTLEDFKIAELKFTILNKKIT